jgi:asparagine synthase (glutamine-hydrolysing)
MCGLFGWILRAANCPDRTVLVSLTDLMAHRGPDGSGYWFSDAANDSFQVAFGHRRLSIIDIAGGSQPMHSEDGAITVTYNGEIYNYVELREELRQLGCRFRTNCDTEVLIEAYRAWGIDALPRFRGMFAFALWDAPNQQLILARDPFGKKPLFVSHQPGGGLLFGSEIEPMTRFPGIDRALNPQAIEQYLLNRYVPGPMTFFRSIHKLPPGCIAIWKKEKLTITRYFTPPFATSRPDIKSFDEAKRMFQETFEDAVRIRMRSDAPFGAYLSGGIDSSAVVMAMMKHGAGRVRTFAVGFEEKAYSELDHARLVANQLGTDHHEFVVNPQMFMDNWPVAIQHRGAPVSQTSDIPILMLSQLASRTVKMVLTGEGSDELMGGYPKHRAEPFVEIYQKLVPRIFHEAIIAPTVRMLPYNMRRAKLLAAVAGERDWQNRMRFWFGGVSVKERDEMLGHPTSAIPPDPYPFSARHQSALRRMLFFDQTSWLADNLLERGDRMMMAHSVEGRMPFMDIELAKVVARFPDKFLTGVKGGKAVLREAMTRMLPHQILTRRKVGFLVPIGEWFRGQYRDFIRDLLVSKVSIIGRICDDRVIGRLVAEHLRGRQDNDKILWALSNLELFLRVYKPSGI